MRSLPSSMPLSSGDEAGVVAFSAAGSLVAAVSDAAAAGSDGTPDLVPAGERKSFRNSEEGIGKSGELLEVKFCKS